MSTPFLKNFKKKKKNAESALNTAPFDTFSGAYTKPDTFNTQYNNPNPQLVRIPYKITGPAIVKILQPIPNTCPSPSVKRCTKKMFSLVIMYKNAPKSFLLRPFFRHYFSNHVKNRRFCTYYH